MKLKTLLLAVENTAPYNARNRSAILDRAYRIACIDLGAHMELARKRAGWTATGAAMELGVTVPHYRDMEKGNRRFLPIHIKQLRKFSDFNKHVA